MITVAKCESQFVHYKEDGTVLRGWIDSRDTGVMQVNTYYHGETADQMGLDLEDLEDNMKYARYLYDRNGFADYSASAPCHGHYSMR